jgi:hypothetical protein
LRGCGDACFGASAPGRWRGVARICLTPFPSQAATAGMGTRSSAPRIPRSLLASRHIGRDGRRRARLGRRLRFRRASSVRPIASRSHRINDCTSCPAARETETLKVNYGVCVSVRKLREAYFRTRPTLTPLLTFRVPNQLKSFRIVAQWGVFSDSLPRLRLTTPAMASSSR